MKDVEKIKSGSITYFKHPPEEPLKIRKVGYSTHRQQNGQWEVRQSGELITTLGTFAEAMIFCGYVDPEKKEIIK